MSTQSVTGSNTNYDESKIKVLKGIEHVRQRPAMYIGDTGETGLHHLVNEVVDNSIDEALGGHCTEITVTHHDDGSVSVEDNGRGIPVGIHEKEKRPAVELVMTKIGAGGKFDKGAYKVSGGLHGVGVSCVNALSQWLEVEVYRDGKIHKQRYERAVPAYDLKVIGETKKRGTRVIFMPDPKIFTQTTDFKFATITRRLRELAYLNAGLKINARKLGEDSEDEVFHFEKGLAAFVEYLNGAEELLLSEPIMIKNSIDSEESGGVVEVEVAIQYNNSYGEVFRSYVNDIHTIDGGTHESGFKAAFTSSFNNYLLRREEDKSSSSKKSKRGKKSSSVPSGRAYLEGLVCVLSVKVPEPQFGGQTKAKLGNPDIKGLVTKIVGEALSTWCEENPKPATMIVNKAQETQRVHEAARKARDLARATGAKMKTPKKLSDCTSKKPEESEIFLVEGDSAGGSARQGRNPYCQAILPLRGKILNVWKATPDKMLGHEEIKAIVTALGTGILDDFNAEDCRYHKIVIMCDADVDGSHIRTLLLTFLFRQMPQLIQRGYVYLAAPPLYGIQKKTNKKKLNYVLDDAAFNKLMSKQGLDGTVLIEEATGRKIEGEDLIKLKRIIENFAKEDRKLGRRGLTLEEYLGINNDDGERLYARLTMDLNGRDEVIDCFTEDECLKVIEALRQEKPDLEIAEDNGVFLTKSRAHIQRCVFNNKMPINELVVELKDFGFTPKALYEGTTGSISDDQLLDEDFDIVRAQAQLSPFRLVTDDGRKDIAFDRLEELPGRIVDLGKSNITVKRFKGLGEMNAQELWDTTMDPAHRKLYKVSLADIAEAQRSFSVLMGSDVEPRRHFIERKSHEVADLDI